MLKNFLIAHIARLFSALIWLSVFYITLPRLFRINFSQSFWVACFIATMIYFFDYAIGEAIRNNLNGKSNLKSTIWLRRSLSIVFSLIAGFGTTVNVFLTQMNNYLPGVRANYIQKFRTGISDSETIFFVFLIIVIVFVVLDSVGIVVSRLQIQNVTLEEQKQVIDYQENQLTKSYQLQMDMISSIQHELGNKLPIAYGIMNDLRDAFKNLELSFPNFSMQNKIRDRLPGEPLTNVPSYSDLLHRLSSTLYYSISIVDNIRGIIKADPSSYQPEFQPVCSWLNRELASHLPDDGSVKLDVEINDTKLNFDNKQLSIAINNLAKNILVHAFHKFDGNKIIKVEVIESNDSVEICIFNTGNPLPTNFSMEKFLEPGGVMGETGNSGLGGYLIGMIIANHTGTINLQKSDRDIFETKAVIKFIK